MALSRLNLSVTCLNLSYRLLVLSTSYLNLSIRLNINWLYYVKRINTFYSYYVSTKHELVFILLNSTFCCHREELPRKDSNLRRYLRWMNFRSRSTVNYWLSIIISFFPTMNFKAQHPRWPSYPFGGPGKGGGDRSYINLKEKSTNMFNWMLKV